MLAFGFSMAFLAAEVAVRLSGIVRNVGPSFTVHDPVYGKRLKQSFSCRRICPEFEMTLTTNSLRFRGPEPLTPPKDGIVFIGDSFTMGYGVNDGEEFPQLVGEALHDHFAGGDIAIVNMGMGDNGNGRWLEFLENEVCEYEPELVVLQICGNDFDDNWREGLFRLDDGGRPVRQAVPPISGLRKLANVVEAVPGLSYSYFVSLCKQVLKGVQGDSGHGDSGLSENAVGGEPSARAAGDELTHALVEEALDICADNGWPVIAICVEVGEPRLAVLRSRLSSCEVDLIEIPDRAQRPDLYYEVDSHWRSSGHRYVAEVIAEQIIGDPRLFSDLR